MNAKYIIAGKSSGPDQLALYTIKDLDVAKVFIDMLKRHGILGFHHKPDDLIKELDRKGKTVFSASYDDGNVLYKIVRIDKLHELEFYDD